MRLARAPPSRRIPAVSPPSDSGCFLLAPPLRVALPPMNAASSPPPPPPWVTSVVVPSGEVYWIAPVAVHPCQPWLAFNCFCARLIASAVMASSADLSIPMPLPAPPAPGAAAAALTRGRRRVIGPSSSWPSSSWPSSASPEQVPPERGEAASAWPGRPDTEPDWRSPFAPFSFSSAVCTSASFFALVGAPSPARGRLPGATFGNPALIDAVLNVFPIVIASTPACRCRGGKGGARIPQFSSNSEEKRSTKGR
mmetsp:Transcript_28684/g.71804  ORF Transcript_28684/g.71804 Transcript_28684/m.71804 type:complete len:253 (-) Transcript_28684:131-889(-)